MVKNKAPVQVKIVSRDKFVRAMCAALWLRNMKSFHPDADRTTDGKSLAFHLSMNQAVVWLAAAREGSQLYRARCQFAIDQASGRSNDLEQSFWDLVDERVIRLKIPGDGTYFLEFDEESARLEVRISPIDVGLLDDLAVRFIREYEFPYPVRSWPSH